MPLVNLIFVLTAAGMALYVINREPINREPINREPRRGEKSQEDPEGNLVPVRITAQQLKR